jgi:hypothetical protein
MLSYLPKLYVISLDLQGLLLFDGSLSYTGLLSFPVAGTMLSAGFVSGHLLTGFALTPGLFQLPKHLLSPGFGVPFLLKDPAHRTRFRFICIFLSLILF